MKRVLIIAMLLFSVTIYACNDGADKASDSHHHTETTADTAQKQVTDASLATLYGCPMHKEMIGSKGDKCPKCNYMELVPVTWPLDGVDTVRVTTLPDYKP